MTTFFCRSIWSASTITYEGVTYFFLAGFLAATILPGSVVVVGTVAADFDLDAEDFGTLGIFCGSGGGETSFLNGFLAATFWPEVTFL